MSTLAQTRDFRLKTVGPWRKTGGDAGRGFSSSRFSQRNFFGSSSKQRLQPASKQFHPRNLAIFKFHPGGYGVSCKRQLAMDQYLLIPFLVGWTSIYQLFWCSPGVQGFDTLPIKKMVSCRHLGRLGSSWVPVGIGLNWSSAESLAVDVCDFGDPRGTETKLGWW